jgi:hypothetical protein
MRSFSRFAIIFFSLIVAFIASFFIIVSISSRPPKEARIVSKFVTHRASYERVRTMLSEDEDIEGVAPWGIQLEGSRIWKIPPDGGMPAERFQEYLVLLKEIGASRVAQGKVPYEVSFGTWNPGSSSDQRSIQISWREHEPSNTVVSLDAIHNTDKSRRTAYVHIDGNWYIWADL